MHMATSAISVLQCRSSPVQVTYPKRTDKPLYHGLVKQLESLNIPFLAPEEVTEGTPLRERYDVIIDAIFGFSFHGSPRPPFDSIVQVHSMQLSISPLSVCMSPFHKLLHGLFSPLHMQNSCNGSWSVARHSAH